MLYTFPDDFKIGATGAAWQMEGETGKKPHQHHFPHLMYNAHPERWHNGVGPTIASDFYRNYKEDVKLFREVGIRQYRFNIDWSRFIADYETGEVDEDGAAYYDDVVNRLIAEGIEPVLCLEHWELPATLYEKYDGYASRRVVDLYVRYAREVFRRFSPRVKLFFCFNEPIVIPQLCFMDGFWWPYVSDTRRAMQWIHGKILATALTVKAFREMGIPGKIGTILNPALVTPRTEFNPQDVRAAEVADAFYWGAFMDTAIKGEYPRLLLDILKKEGCLFDHSGEDLKTIRENTIDILGFNYYQPMRVKAQEFAWNPETPFHPSKYFANWDMPGRRMNPYRGWEINPPSLYEAAMRIKREYGNIEWVVAESGMGVENESRFRGPDGVIDDSYRIDYLQEHLAWLSKAIADGANCKGYWIFASLDNCSPLNAFKNRYGLIEVDIADNCRRTIKKSGRWYKQAADANQFEYKEV